MDTTYRATVDDLAHLEGDATKHLVIGYCTIEKVPTVAENKEETFPLRA